MSEVNLLSMDYKGCCSYLSDVTKVKGRSFKGVTPLEHTFNSLGLNRIITQDDMSYCRKLLRDKGNLTLKSIVKLLIVNEARKLGSLSKVKSVSIPLVQGESNRSTNIRDLVKLRKCVTRPIDIARHLSISASNVSNLEQRMSSNTDSHGVFNVGFKKIFYYAKAIGVDIIKIPVRDKKGNLLKFLIKD